MLPEARAMDVCRALLLSPYCLCEESEVGNWEGSYCTHLLALEKGKATCPSSHCLRNFMLGEVEVSVNIETGQSVM